MMIWGHEKTTALTVTVPNQDALLDSLRQHLTRKEGFSVATLNLDHVVKLAKDPTFSAAYAVHTHVTADGNPIVWLSRFAKQDVALVPGSELVGPLCALAADLQVPVALFGGDSATLTRASQVLSKRYPGLSITFCKAPAMGYDPLGAAAADDMTAIGESGAGLCFLALGAPKQEIFAARAQKTLPTVGFVSIGAGLDFIAGTQKRAPAWVRTLAAEWLWRMLRNPKRLAARYLACIAVLPALCIKAWRYRRRKAPSP